MMLSTKARYAVTAMVYIAYKSSEARPVSLGEISDNQSIPLSFLEQIFMNLRNNGLVRSVRGPGGGYELAKSAYDINISEIIIAVSESLKMTRCEDHSSAGCLASKARCLTHDLWNGLEDIIYRYFKNITLGDVCQRKLEKGMFSSINTEMQLQGAVNAHS